MKRPADSPERPASPSEVAPVYGAFRQLARILRQAFFPGEIYGAGRLPPKGACIVASNHASHADPFVLGTDISRQISYFARKTLWKPGIMAWWLDAVGTIPVDRDGGVSLEAIKRVLGALEEERTILVFPEGTRTPDGRLQAPKPGLGMMACRARVPVIPARVFGSFDAFSKGGRIRFGTPISVVYGPPLYPSDYDRPEDGKERYPRASERIMAAIARLELPQAPVL